MLRTPREALAPALEVTPRSRPTEEGFSLLEVVISLIILSILSLSVLLVIVPISRQLRISREVETANMETARILEQLHATPFHEILDLYPHGTSIPISDLPSGQVSIAYDDVDADPLVVTAVLSWQSADMGPMQKTFRTVRTE